MEPSIGRPFTGKRRRRRGFSHSESSPDFTDDESGARAICIQSENYRIDNHFVLLFWPSIERYQQKCGMFEQETWIRLKICFYHQRLFGTYFSTPLSLTYFSLSSKKTPGLWNRKHISFSGSKQTPFLWLLTAFLRSILVFLRLVFAFADWRLSSSSCNLMYHLVPFPSSDHLRLKGKKTSDFKKSYETSTSGKARKTHVR